MIAAWLATFVLAAPQQATPAREAYAGSVVGLVVTSQDWDDRRPWAKKSPATRRFAGVVVDGPYVVVPAQLLAAAVNVQIEKFGMATRAVPRIVAVDREVNLALLAVDDPSFFADLRPAPLAEATPAEGTLRTVRWRSQQLEIAASRIKRFEVEESYYGQLEHVFLQVQTDLTGGGWGEPVFDDGRLVGLTISQESDQRARVIPIEILGPFLAHVRGPSPYKPLAVFGAKWQFNEDRALAAWLGQTDGARGVLVRQVPWGSSACGVLEPRDILLEVDGRPIDSQGMYQHPRFGRLAFPQILVEGHVAGDTIPVKVIRKGKILDLKMTLRDDPVAQGLIPQRRGGVPPPYLIAGGLVFRELDADYVRSWGNEWTKNAPLNLTTRMAIDQDAQTPTRRRLVILSGVLPTEYTIGYQSLEDLVVESANGRPIGSVAELAAALAQPQNGFQTIRFEPNGDRREIVLEAAGLDEATKKVLEDYGIPAAARLEGPPLPAGGPDCSGGY